MNLKKVIIAVSAFAGATALSLGWSAQDGVSLSINKAEARHHTHVVIRTRYASSAVYVHSAKLPWYVVRAYYWGGPWDGPFPGSLGPASYHSWEEYAKLNGIGCRPGAAFEGGDGIVYLCQ